jgi:asparagine synthase (glutamine-hydrolysing)
MSGISGVVSGRGSGTSNPADRVRRMQEQLRHRGPSAAEVWTGSGVALGYQWTDEEGPARGRQPVTCPDGRCRLVLDGRVQVAASAEEGDPAVPGPGRRNGAAPDALVRLFCAGGVQSVARLRGVFAFAAWHDAARRMTLVRDTLGNKPLYYVHAPDGSLFFASEAKALLAADAVRPTLDYGALPAYLAGHGTSGEATLFAGIRQVPPGHALIWQDGHIRLEAYSSPGFGRPGATTSEDELAERLATLLREAVQLRLRPNAKSGVLLSGSVGSAAVAATLSDLVGEGVSTFTIRVLGDRARDDLPRPAATTAGTGHHELQFSAHDFFASLPSTIWHQDQPIADPGSIAIYHAAALAADHVQEVWTGAGCDELLAIDPRYRKAVTAARMARRVYAGLALPGLRDGVRRTARTIERHSRVARRIARTVPSARLDVRALYLDEVAVFDAAAQRDLLTDEARERGAHVHPHEAILEALDQGGGGDPLEQLLAADLRLSLPELATTHDRIGMAASIESVAPFLDQQLVGFAASLPARMKARQGISHHILRQGPTSGPGQGAGAAQGWRRPTQRPSGPAHGGAIRLGSWLRGPFRPLLHEYVLSDRALGRGILRPDAAGPLVADHESGRADHTRQLWTLINLEIWQRLYVDGEAVSLGSGSATAAAV